MWKSENSYVTQAYYAQTVYFIGTQQFASTRKLLPDTVATLYTSNMAAVTIVDRMMSLSAHVWACKCMK